MQTMNFSSLVDALQTRRNARQRRRGRRQGPNMAAVAAVAHELRNAMGPLGNVLEILAKDGSSEHTVAHTLPLAKRQLNHMARLVDDLLDAGRVSEPDFAMNLAVTDLQELLMQALQASTYEMDRRGHSLQVQLARDPLFARVDSLRISQVLSNLLGNAMKFTRPGGHITVKLEEAGEEARLTISDDGIGIAANELARVFDMFHQEQRGKAMSRGGLGIGLPLSRRLVELHGGRLTAHSDGEDHGSTFVVTLPLAQPPQPH